MLHKFGAYEIQTTLHVNFLGDDRYRGYVYFKGRRIAEKEGFGCTTEWQILAWAADEIKYHKMVLKELDSITDDA